MHRFLGRPRVGSLIALAILVAIAASHLVHPYAGGQAIELISPLTTLLCPEAFLSNGIRTPEGATRYIASILLNAYAFGYLLTSLAWCWRIGRSRT